VTVFKCLQNVLDPEGLWAVSSRQLGQQQKTPNGRLCWDGNR